MNAKLEQQRQQRQRLKAEIPRPPEPKEFLATTVTAMENSSSSTLDFRTKSETVVNIPTSSVVATPAPLSGVVLGVCCEHSMELHPVGVGVGFGCMSKQLSLPLSLPLPLTSPAPTAFAFTLSGTMSASTLDDTDDGRNGTADGGKYLADYQRCWPPPWFILLISFIEISVFVFEYATTPTSTDSEFNLSANIPDDSIFIYRPDRRLEVWRFVSYMVLHANWFHLSFNVVIQLVFGMPLELVHGSKRIAIVYLAGVLAGSLGTSVVDSAVYLVGASGGVYALLAAHLANILLNFSHMRSGISQIISVCIFVACDLGYALYCKYTAVGAPMTRTAVPTVSYIAHMTGSLAGFTVGLLVLRSFDGRLHTRLLRWLALGVYSAFTAFAIAFNLINTMTAQMLAEQEGEVIKQHLLHDFGIS